MLHEAWEHQRAFQSQDLNHNSIFLDDAPSMSTLSIPHTDDVLALHITSSKQDVFVKKHASGDNKVNQSCQKDNIARRRQPYVNSNNK